MPALPASSPDAHFILTAGVVHVWNLDLAGAAQTRGLTALLDAEERARSERLHDETDRTHFIIAHASARILLGRYLGCAPKLVRLAYGINGKPRADGLEGAPDIRFNASRTRGRTAFAFALATDVGVDVEEISDRLNPMDLAARALSPDEARFIRALTGGEQRTAFFALWARKEAFLKACGCGLAIPPSDVEAASDGEIRVKGERQAGWRVRDIALAPGYAAAICAQAEQWSAVVVRDPVLMIPSLSS